MSTTSWQVKKRYNDKTYKRFSCDLKNADFEEIENFREEKNLSRAQLLKMLYDFYKNNY
jgi:predicted DNA-binding ribbon-helix-helix protein